MFHLSETLTELSESQSHPYQDEAELRGYCSDRRNTINNNNEVVETDAPRTESRSSNRYPLSVESYDSEEWTGDEDELLTPPHNTSDPAASLGHSRTLSMPDMGNKDLNVNHQHSHSDINPDGKHMQARHEALQKLATFFHAPKPVEPAKSSTETVTGPTLVKQEAAPQPKVDLNVTPDIDPDDLLLLPPPDLYADLDVE
ncbi:uncharacterized protein LOC117828661 [Notolabrus celidotus]|uniref:uncharacterized protein LOC117828661 n=1 Tax=Notolabrus celidotus TaxID=1203425 RepID=UPI00148FC0A0|nr:uncharacterized protein LOC117828661 [Notolabrus celidotus]